MGHEYEINLLLLFPYGNTFDTSSDDSTWRVFDMRCYGEVKIYPMTTFDLK